MRASASQYLSSGWSNLPIRYKGGVVIAIPSTCLLLALLFFTLLNREQQAAAGWTIHTQQVRLEAGRLLTAVVDAETGMRGYLLTRQERFLEPYQRAQAVIPDSESRLRRLVSDDPSQLKRLDEIESLARERLEGMRWNLEVAGTPKQTARLTFFKQEMDGFRRRIAEFEAEEDRLELLRRDRLQAQQTRFQWGLGLASVMALGGGMLAAVLFSSGISLRLRALGAGAGEMAQGVAVSWPLSGGDEISHLARQLQGAAQAVAKRQQDEQRIHDLNRELGHKLEELAAVNKELEGFSYSVAHDLRAPLRHVDGFSKILLEDHGAEMKDEARRLLERVRDGAQRMGALIDELLNFSRLGREGPRRQITGLNSLVEEARSSLRAESDGRAVEWHIERLPFADCDPALMKQVFSNLLSNALKFTRPRDKAVIEVGQLADNGQTAIFVRDNGVGFDMKYADKLFGVFQRLHRSEDFEGTGVGLALVQKIVQKHGGRIWVEAALDRGATFYFTLGAAEAAPQPTGAATGGAREE